MLLKTKICMLYCRHYVKSGWAVKKSRCIYQRRKASHASLPAGGLPPFKSTDSSGADMARWQGRWQGRWRSSESNEATCVRENRYNDSVLQRVATSIRWTVHTSIFSSRNSEPVGSQGNLNVPTKDKWQEWRKLRVPVTGDRSKDTSTSYSHSEWS